MFKLPNPPSPNAEHQELADFAELLCWHKGVSSKQEILTHLGLMEDNERNDAGCNDDEDENSDTLDEVMNEIERRQLACGGGYPFELDLQGTVLRHNLDNDNPQTTLYRYLLLSTRLNMKDRRMHDGLDGTALFEEICAHVLKNYLGNERARSLVFGTATTGSFEEKVNALCRALNEGSRFNNPNPDASVDEKDGSLDVVAWIPFSDGCVGQLVVFSQCKTGTTWKDHIARLQPDAFIGKWIGGSLASSPVRSFCVSEACNRASWNSLCKDAGLLLDRCRLVDFCGEIDSELLERVSRWTVAAKTEIDHL